MIKYLNTQGVTYYLGELLKNADSRIVLASPYIKLQKRVKEILNQKESHVCIDVICRKDDLKETPMIAANFYDLPDLHAKCYLSEQAAIFTSMNLYEFSQQNNHEMGIYVENRDKGKTLYQEILAEVERLVSVAARFECGKKHTAKKDDSKSNEIFSEDKRKMNASSMLKVGEKYNWHQLKSIFDLRDDYPAGINEIVESKDLVLRCFINGRFPNYWEGDVLYFYGQKAGTGNKVLRSAYTDQIEGGNKRKNHLFVDNVYRGLYIFAQQPYQKNGKWIFPLKPK